MAELKWDKAEQIKLSRMICLLLNRAMMYQADHPHIKDSIAGLHQELTALLPQAATISLILNQDKLFLDDEPVDQRINTSRIVALFKKTGIQSVSLLNGLSPEELRNFVEIFTAAGKYPDSEIMTAELQRRGVEYLKINHVFYKKVTRDEEVVNRQEAEEERVRVSGESRREFQKQFMEMLLQSVLTEETDKALSMKNLMNNPGALSQNMLAAESKGMQAIADGQVPLSPENRPDSPDEAADEVTPGATLLYQIQALSEEVGKEIEEDSQVDMMAVADAVCEMKRQLTLGIESQKALNQAYANEAEIYDEVNTLTDNVIVKLVKTEYQQGKITTNRLAQILRRLVPDPDELKRLLPKIKAALLAEGMPLAEYLQLIQHLGRELESEGLSRVLHEAAETVGVDGGELLEEIRKNPEQAAELMAIAAEIRKGAGDQQAFTEMLIDYVEKLGDSLGQASSADQDGTEEARTRQIMSNLGTGLAAQLKSMNFDNDVLADMEERINTRIDEVFEKLAGDQSLKAMSADQPRPQKTLLRMMEQNLRENDRLKQILSIIRTEADARQIDENDFERIYDRISQQEKAFREQEANRQFPAGVLTAQELEFHLQKELSRAKRHNIHLSTLAFTIINARLQEKLPPDKKIRKAELLLAAYHRLVEITRDSDIVGELNPETMTVILPMTTREQAQLALRRINKGLHDAALEVNGVPLRVLMAGSATSFQPEDRPNIEAFLKTMKYELDHVALRIKNIHNIS
ncbi:MAG: hypothetical protein R6U29_11410 [Desulfosudaceae bacterium]